MLAEQRADPAQGLSSVQFDALAKLCPDMVWDSPGKRSLVLSSVPGDDPLAKALVDEARRLGVDVWRRDFLESGFGVSISRKYDEADLDDFAFLHSCDANSTFLGEVDYPLSCDGHGIPVLAGKPRQAARMFGTPEPLHLSFFVARGSSKDRLERAGFRGLRFHAIEFKRARTVQPEDQLWAVWSDLVLPPVKNLFRTDKGQMGFADALVDGAKNMGPAQGFLTQPELHYRRKEVEALGEFDVALMREPVKIHGTYTKRVVFSQRFRRFVIDELGVPFSGFPVRVDDNDIIPWEGPYPASWSHLNRRPEWLERLQEEVSRRGAR